MIQRETSTHIREKSCPDSAAMNRTINSFSNLTPPCQGPSSNPYATFVQASEDSDDEAAESLFKKNHDKVVQAGRERLIKSGIEPVPQKKFSPEELDAITAEFLTDSYGKAECTFNISFCSFRKV